MAMPWTWTPERYESRMRCMFSATWVSISARRSPIASLRLTRLITARIALSATSRMVSSGWAIWNR